MFDKVFEGDDGWRPHARTILAKELSQVFVGFRFLDDGGEELLGLAFRGELAERGERESACHWVPFPAGTSRRHLEHGHE